MAVMNGITVLSIAISVIELLQIGFKIVRIMIKGQVTVAIAGEEFSISKPIR